MTEAQMPDDDAMLAAEYALGLLTGADHAAARDRMRDDPEFAQAVTDWEIRLATLTDTLEPAIPRPSAKAALLAELFPEPARPKLWQRLWLWQGLSALSVVLLAAVLLGNPLAPTTAPGPLYSAEIVAEAGDFRVVALVDKSTDELILTRTEGDAPTGRILQVWAHGENAPAISVGLWPEGETTRLPMPPVIAAVEGILTIGVSEEPPGGSPTGSPSGRVFGTVDIPGVTNTF